MAIKQTRVIALINAALDFYNGVQRIRTHAAGLQSNILEGTMSYELAFRNLSFFVSESNVELFTNFTSHLNTVTIERAHFTRSIERNKREASKAAQRRAYNPNRRTNADHMHHFQEKEELIAPLFYKPEGMNNRGSLPKSYTPPVEFEKRSLSVEEFEAMKADTERQRALDPELSKLEPIQIEESPEDKAIREAKYKKAEEEQAARDASDPF